MGVFVVVTGGAGFIGSELVRQLAAGGVRVLAVDDLTNGKRANLEGVGGCELVVADIRDERRMSEIVSGARVVYHLACLGVRHSIHSPDENNDVNGTGTLKLLRLARQHGVERFVYVSSSEVYGTARSVPMSELHPTLPHTVYGAGKLAGECFARAYWETYRFSTVVVRPFNAYGPRSHHEGDSGEVIPKFLLRAMAGRPLVVFGDGAQTRDFTFVGDTARGILLAGTTDAAVGQTVNLGTGKEITISDLGRAVADVVGRRVTVEHQPPRPGDVLRLCADASKARDLLGFQAEVELRQGLERLRDFYLATGASPDALLEREVVRNWEARGAS
jgi:UDP-glucose 4-epimerase